MAVENENVETKSEPAPVKTTEEVAKNFYEKKEDSKDGTTVTEVKEEVKTVNTPGEKADEDKGGESTTPTKSDEAKPGEEDKGLDTEKEAKVVPEKYDLKVPEGSKLKATAVERIARIAREQGLSQDEAQQLLVQDHEAVSEYQKALDAETENLKSVKKRELELDPELGGDRLKENSEIVRRGMEANFSAETIKFIDSTGLGNNKVLFRDLLKMGRRAQPDKIDAPKGTAPAARKPVANAFYGENAK